MRLHRLRLTRSHAILRVRHQLEQRSFPRLQMALMVALTGGVGLLSSFSLLKLGMDSMALRYPLSLLMAYLAFLGLLWLWLRTSARDYADIPDLSGIVPTPGTGGGLPGFSAGGGGDFGGGGASGTFDAPDVAGAVSDNSASLGKFGGAGGSFDLDELAIPLIVIALAIGLALASFYMVYLAPSLFAELLFDGVLSFTLYRHLRHQDSAHWLGTAVRKTLWPFGLTAVFLAALGAGMATYAPGARSIGEVIAHHASRP